MNPLMRLLPRKIDHLTRYFTALGILVFWGYLQRWNDKISLIFIGPPLYLAQGLKKILTSSFEQIPPSASLNHFGFLMPVTLFYFGLMGFLLKQLWNERGGIRNISITAFAAFLIYIHYTAWVNLFAYLQAPE